MTDENATTADHPATADTLPAGDAPPPAHADGHHPDAESHHAEHETTSHPAVETPTPPEPEHAGGTEAPTESPTESTTAAEAEPDGEPGETSEDPIVAEAHPPVEHADAAVATAEAEPQPEAEHAAQEPHPVAESQPEPAKPARKPRKSKAATAAVETPAEAPDTPEEAGDATASPAVPAEPVPEPVPEPKKRWYAVKVQSGREESIKAAIERKVKIEGLEEFFGQIVIPVEEVNEKKKVKVKNKKTGETTTQERNVVKKVKKFHGYLFAEVEYNDQILYVFRETSGVGDFVGASLKRAPSPMTDREVQSMLTGIPDPTRRPGQPSKTVVKLDFEKGDKVRIRSGAFVGSEGEVTLITEAKDPTETPKVTVVVTLWGRPVDVVLDYWEVDKV